MALIAHYKLDGNVNDSVGGNHGTWNGTAAYVTGKIGQAGNFNGSSTISFPNTDIIKPTKEVSVSLWFNTSIINDNDYLLLVGRDNHNGYAFQVASSGLYCWAGWSYTGTGISANTTYHAVLTYKSGVGLRLYLNGSLAATADNTGDIPYNEIYGGPAIGGHGSSLYYFNGWIDDVKIYNHALSLKEVKELYKCKILHYKFDQLEEYTTNFLSGGSSSLQAVASISCTYVGTDSDGWRKFALNGTWSSGTYPYSLMIEGYTFTGGVTYSTGCYIRTNCASKFTALFTGMNYVNQPMDKGGTGFSIPQKDGSIFVGRYGFQYTSTTSQNGYFISGSTDGTVFSSSTDFVWIKNAQIEQKDHCTPFAGYSTTRADIITDSSGYGNNGTIDITGPTWYSSAKKGLGCLLFKGTVSTGTEAITSMLSSTTLASLTNCSISFWKKNTAATDWLPFTGQTTSYYLMATGSGTGAFYHSNAGSPTIYRDGEVVTTPATDTTTWHHYVATGVNFSTWTTIKFSGYSSEWAVEGYIDDIRIYATPLSSTDISELYQTAATIHNDGKLTTHSLQEVGPNYKPSLIDYSTWILGQAQTSQYGFNLNGDGNSIITKKNPMGVDDIVWASMNNDVGSDADGGWDGVAITIDSTKKYRYSVWIRRENTLNGTTYFGCGGGTVDTLGSSSPHNNPYFYYGADSFLLNQWCLLISYVWPSSYAGTTSDSTTGIYNSAGQRVGNMGGNSGYGGDFKWHSGATTGNLRTYLFYSTDPNAYQFWYRPRVDLCDGTEPTIGDLLNCRENPNLLTSLLPSNSINWVLSGVVKSATGGLRGTSGGWAAQAYSRQGYTGGAYLRFRVAADRATGGAWMVGINSDPATDASYTSLDYCWYDYTTYAEIYESGSPAWNDAGNPMKVGDTFEIYYDNANVYYYRNGSLKRTVATTAGRTFYVDTSFGDAYTSDQIDQIYFGPQRILTGIQSTGNYVANEFSEVGPTNGLVAYYNFDGASATSIPDVMGLNNGTAYNTPTFTTMGDKKAINLASNKYILSSNSIYIGLGSFSVSFWCYINGDIGSYDMPFYMGGSSASDDGIDFEFGASGWVTIISDGSTAASVAIPSTYNAWIHLVGVLNRSTGYYSVYKNGAYVSQVVAPSLDIAAKKFYIGGHPSYPINGSMAEIRLYNRALDAKDIETLYNLKPTNLYIEDSGVVNTPSLIEG